MVQLLQQQPTGLYGDIIYYTGSSSALYSYLQKILTHYSYGCMLHYDEETTKTSTNYRGTPYLHFSGE